MSSHYITILGYLLVLTAGIVLQVRAVQSPERLPTLGAWSRT
jgi:hypothetical protein